MTGPDDSRRRNLRPLRQVVQVFPLAIPVVLFLLLSASTPGRATEEFARATGKPCAFCHLDPGGGGELTAAGASYAATRHAVPEQRPGSIAKGFRLAVGYLHILTAFFWFGTILYVHLVLKPAYASQGLPRGEVKVGLGSMAVMGITGAILTWYRIPSLDVLLHTRFGILLLIKIGLFLVMVVSALLAVLVIGPRLRNRKGAAVPVPATGNLTPDELALCDGREGRPACFAWNNRIFDATSSRLWKQGMHMGRHQAGTDLTEALRQAPHGEEKILALAQVGELINDATQKPAQPLRLFYVMAYLNLMLVFAIVLILALWRWG